jgi:hypothetical protein
MAAVIVPGPINAAEITEYRITLESLEGGRMIYLKIFYERLKLFGFLHF